MKKQSARLLLYTLLLVLLYGSNHLAARPTNAACNSPQEVKEGCAQRRDTTLRGCENLTGDRKARCQTSANNQYDRCIQSCDSGQNATGNGGGSGKNP